MAVLDTASPTLLDVAKRKDPDGKIAKIVEILDETNEILQDAPWVEGNLETGHRSTIRAGLPVPTWRKINSGVTPTKSETVQVVDNTGNMEAYSRVDMDIADLNGNTSAFRLSEDRPHLEGMNQEFSDTLFYGNEGLEPEAFTGLAPRFNALTADANSDNIISGGGSGADNTSIWLIAWGPETCHLIYPKGKMAGMKHTDKGQMTIQKSDGSYYEAYVAHYKWECGLVIRDWRYIIRICNIDVSELTPDKSGSSADLTDLMAQAVELLPNGNLGRPHFYMNRTVRSMLRRQRANTTNVNIDMAEAGGKKVTAFDEIPVRRCDSLLKTEAAVA